MQLLPLLLWQNKATRKSFSSILEDQNVFELRLSPRKMNAVLPRLSVKCKTMCQSCLAQKRLCNKNVFTLSLQQPDQTFISSIVLKLLHISKTLPKAYNWRFTSKGKFYVRYSSFVQIPFFIKSWNIWIFIGGGREVSSSGWDTCYWKWVSQIFNKHTFLV